MHRRMIGFETRSAAFQRGYVAWRLLRECRPLAATVKQLFFPFLFTHLELFEDRFIAPGNDTAAQKIYSLSGPGRLTVRSVCFLPTFAEQKNWIVV